MDEYNLVEKIDKLLSEHDLWATVYDDRTIGGVYVLKILKEWGDWKHDHLYIRHLVTEFLRELGLPYVYDEVVTEEDGSDTYSAEHIIMIGGM